MDFFWQGRDKWPFLASYTVFARALIWDQASKLTLSQIAPMVWYLMLCREPGLRRAGRRRLRERQLGRRAFGTSRSRPNKTEPFCFWLFRLVLVGLGGRVDPGSSVIATLRVRARGRLGNERRGAHQLAAKTICSTHTQAFDFAGLAAVFGAFIHVAARRWPACAHGAFSHDRWRCVRRRVAVSFHSSPFCD